MYLAKTTREINKINPKYYYYFLISKTKSKKCIQWMGHYYFYIFKS